MRFIFNGLLNIQRKIAWLLLFSLFSLCFVGWLIYSNKKNVENTDYWIDHTYTVIQRIEEIHTRFLSGPALLQKGPAFWETLTKDLDDLQRLTSDNTVQQTFLNDLRKTLYRMKFSEEDLARQAITTTLSSMMQEERALLSKRRLNNSQVDRKSTYMLITGSIAAFLFIVILLIQLNSDIVGRKSAENKLSGSEQKYRNLIENAGAVIYSTNPAGDITFVSAKATELTGFSLEELQGKNFVDLLDPSCREAVAAHYAHQGAAGIPETTLAFLAVTKGGKAKWVEQFAVLLRDNGETTGFQCIVRDISEKKRMELELEKSEFKLRENQAWLQSILDNTTSLIYIKDLSGRYIMANRRFMEVLRVKEDDVMGHTDYDFCDLEKAERYRSLDEEVIRTGRSLEVEEVIGDENGETHLLSIKFPLLDGNGRPFGVSGIATDITERTHYQQRLIAATKEAQTAKGLEEQFLANMSHEIRTPMNGIQGMTDLLLNTPLSTQQKEFAGVIRRSVNNLLVIINDILDFSKIKAGKLAIEKIDFSLEDVLSNVKAIFAHRVQKKDLSLQVEIDPAIPDSLTGDPYRLNQVLTNLIGNAIKFTEKGSIRVTVALLEHTPDRVCLDFSITDTGIGIPAASLPHIFDTFSQAATDTSRRFGGTGLGLSICRQLLQLQGGDISVTSEEGKGSTFHFRLGYGYNSIPGVNTPAAPSIRDYSQCLAGKRFLVAEDNEVNQQLIDHVLRKGGGTVQLAGNGEEAVRLLRQDGSYDLIIMDLQMPVMDGYAATQYIRGELQLPTPIIAMTATALTGEKLRCFEAGMNAYMTKPFEFAELYKTILSL
ncbi:MAG TPA: PAS domain S-box protein [Puia sp.]|jgi:PAS domain S-box-containing protein